VLLGYNTNGFGSHSLEDALRVIGELGYRSVAITIDHAALSPRAPDLGAAVRRTSGLLREQRLVAVIETGARFLLDPWRKHRPTLLEDDPAARRVRAEFLERTLDIATELGAVAVSVWSGRPPEQSTATRDELDRRLCDALSPLCERAARAGTVIALEPEPGMHVDTLADFDRVAEALGHPALRLTLDIGHAHLTEPSALGAVDSHLPRIANVHLEGMQRGVHDHLLPWDGDLDVGALLRALVAGGYRGPATFELSRHSHDAVEVARRALDFARAALRA
jgi:sugar phosphate isomerase/epimerase